MSENEYQKQLKENENHFKDRVKSELYSVEIIIDDAYEILDRAVSLYLKSDVLGDAMTLAEFKQHLLGELKDML